ncbi:MAG: sigma-70 family RNA polymerase sigma factor [Acidobacteriota bacterium]
MSERNPADDVTELLQAWSDGDRIALDRLMPLIMAELKRRAGSYLQRERQGHTLQPTALVNELYLRLIDQNRSRWRDRAHFFAVTAQLMRHILVDHARAHRADKRGGWAEKIELDEERDATPGGVDLIALDDALNALSALDERQGRIVELRFFAGLTIPETAAVLGIAEPTVSRDWRNARAWLMRELGRG